MCQLYLHLFSASGTFDPEDSGTVTCQIEQSAVGATRAMYSYCFSVGCSFFDVTTSHAPLFYEYMFVSYIFPLYKLMFAFAIVNFPSDSFPISHVHAILKLSLSARFSHGADLFFSGKDLFMKHIKNIDLLRAGAILYIMLYHCYVLSGQPWQSHTAIHTLLTLGGEVGVTLFFLLSGYGIYLSLSSSESRGCLPRLAGFL